jgi:isohexenylglutaconyl-CoA hydratase
MAVVVHGCSLRPDCGAFFSFTHLAIRSDAGLGTMAADTKPEATCMFDSLSSLSLERTQLTARGPHLIATLDHAPTKNALTDQLMAELDSVLDAAAGDWSIRSLVLRGANGAFCAGADLKAALALLDQPADANGDPLVNMNRKVGDLYAKLNRFPKVVVAVVEGPAFGGGFGMTCCADLVLASPAALFSLSETTLGLPPAQIAPYVAGRIGLAASRRLALTGMRLDGEAAQQIALVDEVHAAGEPLEARLTDILNLIARCAPQANAVTKEIFLDSLLGKPEAVIEQAAAAFAHCLRSDEGKEGVAAFNEKRRANWLEKV